jgi:predicted CXXCH cytochrome family protein
MYTTVHATQNSGPGGTSSNPELDTTSHLCLSCHDGSIAIDAYGGKTTGSVYMGTIASFAAIAGSTDTDLSADHPLGVGYPGLTTTATVNNGVVAAGGTGASWTSVPGWNDPTQPAFTTGGINGLPAINLVPLPNGLVGVGCGTCHEPHDNTYGFVRMNNNGSALCLKCHAK